MIYAKQSQRYRTKKNFIFKTTLQKPNRCSISYEEVLTLKIQVSFFWFLFRSFWIKYFERLGEKSFFQLIKKITLLFYHL